MKFGIFYELQLPRPWGERSEYQLLQDALAQIELADRLGFDYAWAVEHHFLEEYSHCSAPEVFLGAASQRTRRIRLGHGVVQLPTNHPLRVAERVATLDLISGGRVDLGLGEAQGPIELHPFGRRVRDKRDVWEEAVRAIVPAFTRSSWEWHGPYFDFPARNVVPKPLQKPHPPLWVACSNITTIASAVRCDHEPPRAGGRVDPQHRAVAAGRHDRRRGLRRQELAVIGERLARRQIVDDVRERNRRDDRERDEEQRAAPAASGMRGHHEARLRNVNHAHRPSASAAKPYHCTM